MLVEPQKQQARAQADDGAYDALGRFGINRTLKLQHAQHHKHGDGHPFAVLKLKKLRQQRGGNHRQAEADGMNQAAVLIALIRVEPAFAGGLQIRMGHKAFQVSDGMG